MNYCDSNSHFSLSHQMVICLFNFIRNSWTALQIRTIFSFHQQNLKVLGIPHPICRTDYRLPGRHASGRIISARCQCVDPWDVCVCVCVRAHTHVHARSVTQLCLTVCNRLDGSLPGSSIHQILQARILEWVAVSFSRSSWPRDWTHVFCISSTGRQILHHCTTWEAPF